MIVADGASRDRYLHHVTLSTGHVRRSPRSEVEDRTIQTLRPLLERVVQGERVALEWPRNYQMSGAAHGRCALVTLTTRVEVDGHLEYSPVVSVGVAPHSRCGAHLWRLLHQDQSPEMGGPFRTHVESVPPEPWCADRLMIGAALNPEAVSWTGDWSRCVAWTWIEIVEARARIRQEAE